MDKNSIKKERIRILDKLSNIGYDTDKRISEMQIEDLLMLSNFKRSELTIAIGLKKAVVNKELAAFLNGVDIENLKGGDE